MIIILVILIFILCVYSFFATLIARIQYKKSLFYQDKMINFSKILDDSNEKLKKVDVRGSFSSDDEIGFAFKIVSHIIEELNQFIDKE